MYSINKQFKKLKERSFGGSRSEGAGGRMSSWKLRPLLGRKEGAGRGVGICRTVEAEPEDVVRGCVGLREGRW